MMMMTLLQVAFKLISRMKGRERKKKEQPLQQEGVNTAAVISSPPPRHECKEQTVMLLQNRWLPLLPLHPFSLTLNEPCWVEFSHDNRSTEQEMRRGWKKCTLRTMMPWFMREIHLLLLLEWHLISSSSVPSLFSIFFCHRELLSNLLNHHLFLFYTERKGRYDVHSTVNDWLIF